MLTLFSTPKAFEGLFDTLQHNAIASWRALMPRCEILLFGDDAGVSDACKAYDCEHLPDVRLSAKGTPMLDDMFVQAQQRAAFDRVAYVNADIILSDDLLRGLGRIDLPRYLMVGRRVDLDVTRRIDFGDANEVARLWTRAKSEGRLHSASGIDYFVFPRGQVMDLPPFPVGRILWDNWLIYNTRRKMTPVIDATAAVTIIHQNHDYSHVAGGSAAVHKGPEVQANRELVGRDFLPFTTDDATWRLEQTGLKRAWEPARLLRHLVRAPALVPGLRRSVGVGRRIKRLLSPG